MSDDKPHPTKWERDRLIAERKKDFKAPAPAPAPRPEGTGINLADRRRHWEQIKIASQREDRIREIDSKLNKARGVAKSAFDRVR